MGDQMLRGKWLKCISLAALSAMFVATGIAHGTLPSNTTVSMQSEFVKGAYDNMTGTYTFGTIYPNGTAFKSQYYNGSHYYVNYTVTGANSVLFNLTTSNGVVDNVSISRSKAAIVWPAAPSDTIGSAYPYTNDTNRSDYTTYFSRAFSTPPASVSVSVTGTTYDYNGTHYAAINATMSAYAFGYSGYLPQYPTICTVIFSPYSGIEFYQSLNVTHLEQNSSINGSGAPPIATQYISSIFQLNSTNMAIGEQQGRGGGSYTLLATGAAGAVVIASAIMLVRHRNKHL